MAADSENTGQTAGPEPSRQSGGHIARSALARGMKLASLPLGQVGRATVGWGRRLGGAPAQSVSNQMSERAAEQLFRVLGDLKGGAMKFGQALSLFEAVLPEDVAAPYRNQLKRLQDSAPPMPMSRVQAVLAHELGPDWRSLFGEFDPLPAAAASIGQVHRATWAEDGQEVAVKVQYPGADEALRSDLKQIGRLAAVVSPLTGGIDVKPLVAELTERISEEVDYEVEAAHQSRAAERFADHPEFLVPRVLTHTSKVLVSEWVDGEAFGTVADLPEDERNAWALHYVRFLFAGPSIAGLLHADPHPGNFKVLPDGRLGVIDWGLVSRLPDGLPPEMGRILRIGADGDAVRVRDGLVAEGFLNVDVDPADLLDYLNPFIEPAAVEEFEFTRDWMRREYRRVSDSAASGGVGMKLNLPPSYLLIHRVWLGGVAVLSQLNARSRFRAVLEEFLPGYAPEDDGG